MTNRGKWDRNFKKVSEKNKKTRMIRMGFWSGLREKGQNLIELIGKRLGRPNLSKPVLITAVGLVMILAGWLSGYAYYQKNLETVYDVLIDGVKVGTVKDPRQVEEWLEGKLAEVSQSYGNMDLELSEGIRFKKGERFNPAVNVRTTLNALEKRIHVQANAVKVEIDGRLIGYASSPQVVDEVIREVKAGYVGQEVLKALEGKEKRKASVQVASASGHEKSEVVAVRLKESLSYTKAQVAPHEVLSQEELKRRLQEPKVQEVTYTVKEGDVLGKIAARFGLSLDELLALNPGLREDSLLKIGQKVRVQKAVSLLTVVEEERVVKEERIPYQTVIKEDSNLYKGQARVEREGKAGKKRVEYLVTKENGQEVARRVLSERILEKPVDKVVVRGTKEKPSRGSGKFIWPTRGGYVSSRFGYRWGRLHAGIDIAGVGDRTILAADHGRVVQAGWHSGGYGNHVVIDHQNGYRTLYAHLSSIKVRPGDRVERGQAIGVMGSTGNSTGVHLHFEIHRHGRAVNPLPYVR